MSQRSSSDMVRAAGGPLPLVAAKLGVGSDAVRYGFEETVGGFGDFLDCGVEGGLICLGWFLEATYFANELEGGGGDLLGRHRRFGAAEDFDAATHGKGTSRT